MYIEIVFSLGRLDNVEQRENVFDGVEIGVIFFQRVLKGVIWVSGVVRFEKIKIFPIDLKQYRAR